LTWLRLFKRHRVLSAVFAFAAAVAVARVFTDVYTGKLWFDSVGFSALFWKPLVYKLLAAALGAILAVAVLLPNYLATRRSWELPHLSFSLEQGQVAVSIEGKRAVRNGLRAILVIIVAFTALSASHRGYDLMWLVHRRPFGTSDPVFGNDISFYIFTLPVLKSLVTFVLVEVVLAFMLVAGVYLGYGSVRVGLNYLSISARARRHLTVLVSVFLAILGVSQLLSQYSILYSDRGAVFGAGYTDLRVGLPAIRVMAAISFAAALVAAVSVRRFRWRVLSASLFGVIVAAVLLRVMLPALVEKLRVEPNQVILEKPFIERTIRLTRLAYGLADVQDTTFVPSDSGDWRPLLDSRRFLENIKLWDLRPLKQTYRQLQQMRLYYKFPEIDVDRYRIDGAYTQVMLAAREMDVTSLPEAARTWVNVHLKYTHGYGICMSSAGRITREGLPFFYIKDIPPNVYPGLRVERPELYYGEKTDEFVIVGAKGDEFDFPEGDENAYTRHRGKGGVGIGSFLRRLCFAWKLGSLKLVLSSDVTPQSRLLLERNVLDRLRRIAPFLYFDPDCYPVLVEGRIYWIVDAYAVSDRYPYSAPVSKGVNYVRNSIKAVVDAYDGSVTFYRFDGADPLTETYADCFPGWLAGREKMDPELRAHVRYPRELFMLQSMVYASYHMTDPVVFYNKEDLWALPRELYLGSEQTMEAYYVTMTLPGSEKEEFMLMLPFTPAGRDNMIAWLAARCDGEKYGELVCFKFPKQSLVYGPMQVEARIDQTPSISSELSLWGQKGSEVIRGNLLVLPLSSGILYVEPLFLKAERGELPELRRTIVSDGKTIVMRPTLREALQELVAGRGVPQAPSAGSARPAGRVEAAPSESLKEAIDLLRSARKALEEGSWAEFGRKMDRLEKLLEALEEN